MPIVAKTIEEELNSLPKKEWEKRGAIGYEWNPSTEEDTNIEIGDIVCVKGKTTDEGEQNAIIYGNVVGKRTIENEDGTTFIVFDIISAALVIGEQPNNLVLTIVSKPKLWAKWGEVGADGATKGTITLYQAYTE